MDALIFHMSLFSEGSWTKVFVFSKMSFLCIPLYERIKVL